jgi:GntR family transcriptional regulator
MSYALTAPSEPRIVLLVQSAQYRGRTSCQMSMWPASPVSTNPAEKGARRPLYLEVADRLRANIADGTFRGALPSQDRLCELLEVSRPTIREAIRVLEQTGLLSSRQGAATVINYPPRVEAGFEELFSTSELLARGGLRPGTPFIDLRQTLATGGTFPVFAGRPVFVIERVRTANDVPFVSSVDVIPDDGYDERDLRPAVADGSLVMWLEARGVGVRYARTALSAATAERPLDERLEVPPGTPLLSMEEVGYGVDDRPVYYSNDFYRCDVTQFHILRRRRFL